MSVHLVIGASGQVGGALLEVAATSGITALGTYNGHAVTGLRKLDLRDEAEVEACLAEVRPSSVLLAAAMGNVEHCETHPQESYAVNVTGVLHLINAANRVGATVVYFSTDYIFDGVAGPYREDDAPNPLSEYGRQKLLAEQDVLRLAKKSLVVRTTVVYGWERQRKNFVCRLVDTLRRGQRLKAPADQIGSPTYAPNLAAAVWELLAREAEGVYHVVGPERVGRDEFAREAARAFGLDPSLIDAVRTEDLGQVALRPLNAGMRTDKVQAVLKVKLLPYREGLKLMAATE